MLTRRRFILISAALAATPARADLPIHHWRGVAMGAGASIRLSHPDAAAICARAEAEISRLEDIFSLYRSDSALSVLNATGTLEAPPPELLQCLGLAGSVHQATEGRFDPTVQRLWQVWAEAAVAGHDPDPVALAQARGLTGWDGVALDAARITLRPGMALTLNGIAQGFVADRVADLLAAEGLTNILIDTGEMRALGGQPSGNPWPVHLSQGGKVALTARALATSAPLGTVLDPAGRIGHILNSATGQPAAPVWRGISVSAPSAALADALSTAACLMPNVATIRAALDHFAECRLEAAVPV